jgi:hypothetical protein
MLKNQKSKVELPMTPFATPSAQMNVQTLAPHVPNRVPHVTPHAMRVAADHVLPVTRKSLPVIRSVPGSVVKSRNIPFNFV